MTTPCAVCGVADGCHCLPLWPDVQDCGCPDGEGHQCRPPWMDEAEWQPDEEEA